VVLIVKAGDMSKGGGLVGAETLRTKKPTSGKGKSTEKSAMHEQTAQKPTEKSAMHEQTVRAYVEIKGLM
jgi:hypothetical protein